MFEEREPEPGGRRATILKNPLVVEDADYQRLIECKSREGIVCIPLRSPRGVRRGVFAYVEGASRKDFLLEGKPYRIMTIVRGKRTSVDPKTGRKITTVSVEVIAHIPREGIRELRGPLSWH